MSRAAAWAAVAAAAAATATLGGGGCGFAVKHPAITAGIVSGTIALATCELATPEHAVCFAAAGAAGGLIGLITGGALLIGSSKDDSILQPIAEEPVRRRPAQPRPVGPRPVAAVDPAPVAPIVVPPYLEKPPELFARDSTGAIVPAPAGDQAVAASYARSPVRGPLDGGVRLTILTARTRYRVNEEVRVIHVLEAPEPGHELRVMGPKPIRSEFVDGIDRAGPAPAAADATYDGRVVPSPGADFNYEVTSYRFATPGAHRIQWRDTGRASNVLEIQID